MDEYRPNSGDAVLSRIETKLDTVIKRLDDQDSSIRRLWAALGRLDVRVAGIAAGISVAVAVAKIFFGK